MFSWINNSSRCLTLVPVQAATTSWIVHGVTITMNPRDMAAIVREALVLRRLSCATSCRQKYSCENPAGRVASVCAGGQTGLMCLAGRVDRTLVIEFSGDTTAGWQSLVATQQLADRV
jgi:hypothetical protein